jgi:hypothetical protein
MNALKGDLRHHWLMPKELRTLPPLPASRSRFQCPADYPPGMRETAHKIIQQRAEARAEARAAAEHERAVILGLREQWWNDRRQLKQEEKAAAAAKRKGGAS